MREPLKQVYTAIILFTGWLLNILGNVWADLSGFTDWSLIGWAFAASTGFVVWEAMQPKPIKRKGWHRAGMILMGMIMSLGLNQWLSERLGIPIVPVTIGLGAVGYKLFGFMQKKADKPEETIKDLTK